MPFHLYILHSGNRHKFYVGHTGDAIEERVKKHNSNHKGFTGGAGDWKVVYTECYETKTAAYAREREIKAWKSRKRIEFLVASSAHSAS